LEDAIDDTEMAAGSEAYHAALVFYKSVKMVVAQDIPGARAVYEKLKTRFPQTGARRTPPAKPNRTRRTERKTVGFQSPGGSVLNRTVGVKSSGRLVPSRTSSVKRRMIEGQSPDGSVLDRTVGVKSAGCLVLGRTRSVKRRMIEA
jgi:hypothetical protein